MTNDTASFLLDCKEVLHLHNQFLKLYEKNLLSAEVYSFVETVLTFMFITNVRVVSVDSAGTIIVLKRRLDLYLFVRFT